MGTANFRGMGDFGVWAFIPEYDKEFYEEQYPGEDGYDDDFRYRCFQESASDDYELVYGRIKDKIDDLNDTLVFHKLGVNSGYYEGIEIILTEEPGSDDAKDLAEILEEKDLPFYIWDNYGTNLNKPRYLAKAKAKYLDECRRIYQWLEEVAKPMGFEEYGVYARFSNGETWYNQSGERQKEEPVNATEYFFSQERKGLFSRFKGKKPTARKPLINLRRK